MNNAINAVLALQGASGTSGKQKVLREYKDSEDFCRLLYYALNPMLTYKISEQTLRSQTQCEPDTMTTNSIYQLCDELSSKKALDAATVRRVCAFIQCHKSHEREFYIKLLAKTLRLGVTAKTVNKIIPGLIPEWEVQQAYPIDKHPLREGVWFALTQKLNGVRATYYKGRLYARSGIPYEGLEHITDMLRQEGFGNFVLDGELTLRDKDGMTDNEAFRKAAGIVNSDSEDKTCIYYTIFDVLPTDEFERGQSELSYQSRRLALEMLRESFPEGAAAGILPVLYMGRDQSKISQLLDRMVKEDKEGLIVNMDVPYQRKRHKGILKVKRFYTMDLPVLCCEEGSGRLKGTLGAFVLQYKGNEVRVGSGFTDEQRSYFWSIRDDLPGTLCEVKYKEISSDKSTGESSLQFPVFVSLQTDKSDVSYG